MTWLKCVVGNGAFSDESVVEVQTADGRDLSFFVPKEKVRPYGNVEVRGVRKGRKTWATLPNGKVEVRVVRKGGKMWVTLPTADPFSAILVRSADVFEEKPA